MIGWNASLIRLDLGHILIGLDLGHALIRLDSRRSFDGLDSRRSFGGLVFGTYSDWIRGVPLVDWIENKP